ncbi:hypothetical protein DMENIID0001_052980 [Sergentomyia squamirostris]
MSLKLLSDDNKNKICAPQDSLNKSTVEKYKLLVLVKILKQLAINPNVPANDNVKKYLLTEFMPKVCSNLNCPKEAKSEKVRLSSKDCDFLQTYICQQIPQLCGPVLQEYSTKAPYIFDKFYTMEDELSVISDKRQAIITTIAEAREKKCAMLVELFERGISQEILNEQETLVLKLRVKELKARIIKLTILHRQTRGEGEEVNNIASAYMEIERELNEILEKRGIQIISQ